MIPYRAALLVSLMLGENASQVNRTGFGGPIGLLAFAALQFLFAHRQTSGIGSNVELGHGLAFGQGLKGLSLLPLLGPSAHLLDNPLDLAGRDADTSGLSQV